MHGLVAAGADVLELGVPFLRPDGGWPHHPARFRTCVEAWHFAARCWAWWLNSASKDATTPVVLMG